MIKAKVDDKDIELTPEQLELPDGYALITPDNIPKGYYTEDAVQTKIKERVDRAKEDAKKALSDDKEFHSQVFQKYDISLDEDGNPKGLKPDFDPEEWKSKQAEKLTKPLKEEKEKLESQLQSMKRGMVESHILKSANGLFEEQYTQSFTDNDDPFVVQKFSGLFDVDENGVVALKDDDGFAVDGDGSRITPDKFFEANRDKFEPLLKDNRQQGSNFGKPGQGGAPSGDPGKWSVKQKNDYIAKHGKDGYKQLLQSRKG